MLTKLSKDACRVALLFLLPAALDSAGAQGRAPKTWAYAADQRASQQWSVEPIPILRIGGVETDGPTEFSSVVGVIRTSDGRVIVADAGSTELRLFSSSGQFVRTIGRKGQGPGEYDGLRVLFRTGDTLVAHDRALRLQLFTADGQTLRSYPRPVFTGHGLNQWHGIFSDGSGVVQGVDPVPETSADKFTQTGTLGIVKASTTEAKAFTQIDVFERVRFNGTSVGLFLGGVSQVATAGDRVCTGYSIRWEIRCFDRNGTQVSHTIRKLPLEKLRDSDIDTYKAAYAAANSTRPPDVLRNTLANLQFAEHRAQFGRFVPAVSRELWVGEFVVLESFVPGRRGVSAPPSPSSWSVIAADGQWIADVTLPARFTLMDAGRDYVAGVQLDADDVEQVVVYRLRRSR